VLRLEQAAVFRGRANGIGAKHDLERPLRADQPVDQPLDIDARNALALQQNLELFLLGIAAGSPSTRASGEGASITAPALTRSGRRTMRRRSSKRQVRSCISRSSWHCGLGRGRAISCAYLGPRTTGKRFGSNSRKPARGYSFRSARRSRRCLTPLRGARPLSSLTTRPPVALAESGCVVVLISHHIPDLMDVADRVVALPPQPQDCRAKPRCQRRGGNHRADYGRPSDVRVLQEAS
jgi:hypothetical protein